MTILCSLLAVLIANLVIATLSIPMWPIYSSLFTPSDNSFKLIKFSSQWPFGEFRMRNWCWYLLWFVSVLYMIMFSLALAYCSQSSTLSPSIMKIHLNTFSTLVSVWVYYLKLMFQEPKIKFSHKIYCRLVIIMKLAVTNVDIWVQIVLGSCKYHCQCIICNHWIAYIYLHWDKNVRINVKQFSLCQITAH